MAKGFSAKGFTAKPASVSPRISSVPGNSARARINEAAGQKVQGASGAVIGSSKAKPSAPMAVASGSGMVMPVDHPSAKTTRTTKGGTA